jgi:hypothetical protein
MEHAKPAINKAVAALMAKYDSSMAQIIERIARDIDGKTTAQARAIINAAFENAGIDVAIKNVALDGVMQAVKAGTGKLPSIALRRWWYDRAYSAAGTTFKSELATIVSRKEIISTVTQALKTQRTWTELARELQDKALARQPLPSKAAIEKAARKAFSLSGDTQGYAAYKKAIGKAYSAAQSKSGAALKDVIADIGKQTKTAVKRSMNRAVSRQLAQSQRYQAERIARTEIARSYGQAVNTDADNDEDIDAVEWVLSSAHDIFDVCFAENTIVMSEDKNVFIQDIKIGDKINDAYGNMVYVTGITNRKAALVEVSNECNWAHCTHDHPFLTDIGFVPAYLLEKSRLEILMTSLLTGIARLFLGGEACKDK